MVIYFFNWLEQEQFEFFVQPKGKIFIKNIVYKEIVQETKQIDLKPMIKTIFSLYNTPLTSLKKQKGKTIKDQQMESRLNLGFPTSTTNVLCVKSDFESGNPKSFLINILLSREHYISFQQSVLYYSK